MRHERIDPGQGPADAGASWEERIYVRDVMSWPRGGTEAALVSATEVSVGPGMPVEEALHLMADRSIESLPVVQDGRVIGILTQSDAVTALARRHSP